MAGVFASKSFDLSPKAPIASIKIDVEGAELSVLQGATTILSERKPIILCEILDVGSLNQIENFLRPYGYTVKRISLERNYLLCPSMQLDGFELEFASWKEQKNGILEMKVKRDLVLRIDS